MGNNVDAGNKQQQTNAAEIEKFDSKRFNQLKTEVNEMLDDDLTTEAHRVMLKGMKNDIDELLQWHCDLEQLVADQAMPIKLLELNIAGDLTVQRNSKNQQIARRDREKELRVLLRQDRLRECKANGTAETSTDKTHDQVIPPAKDSEALVAQQMAIILPRLQEDAKESGLKRSDLHALLLENNEPIPLLENNVVAASPDLMAPVTCKEGWLNKQSKHLNVMRKRWTVLQRAGGDARYTLCTYAEYKTYEKATAQIELNQHVVVEAKNLCTDMFIVYNQLSKEKFVFQAANSDNRAAWIEALKAKCNAQL
eukprot:CAMPEP_0202690810 /NCGR_PEP_ID=MMETSP1385-20130828/5700_1 /ASSEMBLY_ACC=CAM_ASM_000861 /TAXON_ID=933848 /ORGANISM="Elphidium margaritaceum" /LENGTH=309 /DNA_ID=CAMNT_0049346117 /DNA_START=19 /DNA_END=948 /DNA_ORIENTATION=+